MLHLITGLPGSAKTAFTLHYFLSVKGRPKYATYIPGFDYEKHGVEKIESLPEWVNLPDGSIIFCDEGQKWLRPRRKDAAAESWLTDLETHRHEGIDIYVTTQHPMFIDVHFRRLVGEHIHYFRPYNTQKLIAKRLWQKCQDDPDDFSAKNEAEITHVSVPKSIFSEFTSTSVDTHKFKIPSKLVKAALAILIIFGLAFYFGFDFFSRSLSLASGATSASPAPVAVQPSPAASAPAPAPASSDAGFYAQSRSNSDKALTAADFVPVHPLAPWSAPFYASQAKPVAVPRFSGCLQIRDKCRCFTQQGTSLDVDRHQCDLIVAGQGSMPFDPFKDASPERVLPRSTTSKPLVHEDSISVESSNVSSRTFDVLGPSGFIPGQNPDS